MAERPEDVSTRLDKWLWAARFFKTRSLAQQAIDAGRVTLNGTRAKPAKETRIDDVLEIVVGTTRWAVRVRRISDVRGPAGIAQTLYAETEDSMLARAAAREHARLYPEPARQGGRPTKRDRRTLARVAGKGLG